MNTTNTAPVQSASNFSDEERRGLYRAIHERHSVRTQFLPTPVPPDVLARVLLAAHHAPSVGFMQPWDFIVIDDQAIKEAVQDMFDRENHKASANYTGERVELYRSLRLDGIRESPLNLCITCDRTRGGPHVLGRNSILDADLFSACLAVQNLWLAAHVEGIGINWVSIIEPADIAALLHLPDHVYPLAYLCMGYAREIPQRGELEAQGWRSRLHLPDLVHANRYGQPVESAALSAALAAAVPPPRPSEHAHAATPVVC